MPLRFDSCNDSQLDFMEYITTDILDLPGLKYTIRNVTILYPVHRPNFIC